MRIGARWLGQQGCWFTVWAPHRKSVSVKIVSPEEQIIPMSRDEQGYWHALVENLLSGALYFYRLDESMERPDPASHYQPQGVHGPSQVIDHTKFKWEDSTWKGIPLTEMIVYELHVGTFTTEGTFMAIIDRLDDLIDLGINAVEVMPVAQFPGARNWGYDGVYPFSVQDSYGGPDGLKELVTACHRRHLSVIIDAVYNHLGPEGNYLGNFGPYFTDKYRTPWGQAVNFDDAYSDEVRNYFIQNALHWFRDYHIDALRLDATDAIHDHSARPFLGELAETVAAFSRENQRKYLLIAESDLNDARVIQPKATGGYDMDAQWCDDFHHSLWTLLTGERNGYYESFGSVAQLVKSFREGFVYSGEYSSYRKRRHGNSSAERPAHQFVVCSQNHDQVGNRMLGERLSHVVAFEAAKLAAATVILSPFVPLLFMGEEYGEPSPFLYFVSHGDVNLIEAVRNGRKEEFHAFKWRGEPPDPQSEETFLRCKLNWHLRNEGSHQVMLDLYKHLIELRKSVKALSRLDKKSLEATGAEETRLILLRRWIDESQIFCAMNFNQEKVSFRVDHAAKWTKLLDTADERWSGPGASLPDQIAAGEEVTIQPSSFALFEAGG